MSYYDFMDRACAESLGVDLVVYIEKIEKTTPKRAEIIITGLVTASINDDLKLLEKVKRIFNLIS
jgi:hypothetical protein